METKEKCPTGKHSTIKTSSTKHKTELSQEDWRQRGISGHTAPSWPVRFSTFRILSVQLLFLSETKS